MKTFLYLNEHRVPIDIDNFFYHPRTETVTLVRGKFSITIDTIDVRMISTDITTRLFVICEKDEEKRVMEYFAS